MKYTVVPTHSVIALIMELIKMQAFFLVTIKAEIRCVDLSFFYILFQIRIEPMSCLTLHNVYGSRGSNRTATLNIQTCIDRTRSPVAAAYQVGKYRMFKKQICNRMMRMFFLFVLIESQTRRGY